MLTADAIRRVRMGAQSLHRNPSVPDLSVPDVSVPGLVEHIVGIQAQDEMDITRFLGLDPASVVAEAVS